MGTCPKARAQSVRPKARAQKSRGDLHSWEHIRNALLSKYAIEELHAAFEPSGAELIGKTDPAGYDFSDSKSLVDGKFLGLPLDDDNEEDKTETRVENWCVQLVSEGMK